MERITIVALHRASALFRGLACSESTVCEPGSVFFCSRTRRSSPSSELRRCTTHSRSGSSFVTLPSPRPPTMATYCALRSKKQCFIIDRPFYALRTWVGRISLVASFQASTSFRCLACSERTVQTRLNVFETQCVRAKLVFAEILASFATFTI